MRTGILGGTFDPLHVGHLYMAEECKYLLNLDKVIIIPNGDPPHKDKGVTPSEHRFAMAKAAFMDKDSFIVSDIEIRNSSVSYTYLTLSKLRMAEYKNDELFFIMGADSLINFKKWKNPLDILKMVELVCFDRPGYRENEVKEATEYIRNNGGKVTLINSLDLEISSTDIRNRVKEGRPYEFFLNDKVASYIEKHGLYK